MSNTYSMDTDIPSFGVEDVGTARPSARPDSTGALLDYAQAVHDIASGIEEFFSQQFRRLEHALDTSCPSPDLAAVSRELQAQLEQERANWERERQMEVERLREEGARLADSWARLEAEQRRVLAERELRQFQTVRDRAARPSRDADVASQPTSSRYESAQLAESTLGEPGPLDSPGISREEAVRQFHQLRREIGKHKRANR